MKPAPIVLFVYKRPDHARRTIEALLLNSGASESDLIVYSDGPKDAASEGPVREVRVLVDGVRGFRSVQVHRQERNRGLARSVIAGVTETLAERGRAIVVEDDLVTSRHFLRFMNEALEAYERDPLVMSITGLNFPIRPPIFYRHDVYLSRRSSSWGWATWQHRWAQADWEMRDYPDFARDAKAQRRFNLGGADLAGMLRMQMESKIDSWAIRWAYAHFKQEAYCLFPTRSLVRNIGLDGSGTHCTPTDRNDVTLDDGSAYRIRLPRRPQPSAAMLRRFLEFQNGVPPGRMKLFSFLKALGRGA